MSDHLGQILSGLGEVKGELVGVARQLEDGNNRMTRLEEQSNETREISLGTRTRVEQLVAKVAEQNGRIGKGETRADRIEARLDAIERADIRAEERAKVKAEARETASAFARRVWGVIEKPVLLALGLGILAGTAWTTREVWGFLTW